MAITRRKQRQMYEMLLNGATVTEIRETFGYTPKTTNELLSRLGHLMLEEIGLTWHHCVALCYASRQGDASERLSKGFEAREPVQTAYTKSALEQEALEEFLAAKDVELDELEVVRDMYRSKLPKANEATA